MIIHGSRLPAKIISDACKSRHTLNTDDLGLRFNFPVEYAKMDHWQTGLYPFYSDLFSLEPLEASMPLDQCLAILSQGKFRDVFSD